MCTTETLTVALIIMGRDRVARHVGQVNRYIKAVSETVSVNNTLHFYNANLRIDSSMFFYFELCLLCVCASVAVCCMCLFRRLSLHKTENPSIILTNPKYTIYEIAKNSQI